jgi:Ca2+-binding RTX toxin-like protein
VTGGSSTTVTATNSTGNITLTTTTLAPVVTTGSGDDNITVNGADVHTIMTNDGDDTITVDDTAATSTIDGGAGDDTFDLNDDDTAYVVIGGAGDDTFQINKTDGDSNMVIIGGDGSDDTLDVQGAIDTTASSNTFAISGIEVIELDDVNGTMSISAAQFANNNTVKLEGTGNDTLLVAAAATGSTIDASGVTFESTQAVDLTLQAGRLADTITGSAKNDTITAGAAAASTGGADSYDGGAGTDTFIATNMNGVTETGSAGASTGVVINLGSTAISGTAVLAKVDDYISAALTEVASGTMTYTYAASSASNASSVSTIVNVENITGTTGADYIVGDAGANAISSNGGNDYIVAGAGADTITAGGGTDTIVIASADTGNTIDTADVVTSFTTGTDKLSLGTAGAGANYTEVAGVAGDTFADAAADANTAMNGTVKYVYIYGLDADVGTGGVDGADGALFIDADLDGTFDDVIVLTAGANAAFLAETDIIA